jgi:hypothetical protein
MCRKRFCKTVVGLLLLWGIDSQAGFNVEMNGFYFTDNFTDSSTSSSAFTAADFALNLNLNKKGTVAVGWAYTLISSSTSAGSSNTAFAAGDMGPRFLLFFDKDRTWELGVTYNLLANATYSSGGGSEMKWRGTSIKADFGWAPAISDSAFFGFRFNYYSASWTEQLIGSSTYSTVAYTRAWIYPSLYFRWEL